MNSLPPSLIRFESQLEDAIGSHQRRRPRRLGFRTAVAAAAAAAITFGALSALPGGGASVVARAAAALNPSDGTILHTVVLSIRSDTGPSGTTETWRLNAPPYDERSVQRSGNHRREHASANGRPEYYDVRTNTIYTVPAGTELPAPRQSRGRGERLVVNYLDRPGAIASLRSLLASGKAREDGRRTVGGRNAIRIAFSDVDATLLVDAGTYEPIEVRIVSDEGIVITDRFQTYERLPATKANLALLSLSAQHPSAKVERTLQIEGVGGK